MIPFRDNIPSRSFPIITVFIILINIVAFFYELSLGRGLDPFVFQFGVIPARVLSPSSDTTLPAIALPFFTSMFLHAGWMHLIGNMWYLWIFGDNVEDRLGHVNYLIFYILCGLGAGVVHTLLNPSSTVPSLGASGAIAGVLGAYMVSYPFAKVLTLLPLFIIWPIVEIPAIIVLGFWFIFQFLSGAESLLSADAGAGGVAFWAHVGGFVIGIILLRLFHPPPVRYTRYEA
jgi:membrane associated rhomboid family serine protease